MLKRKVIAIELRKMRSIFYKTLLHLLIFNSFAYAQKDSLTKMSYLENKQVKVGVDLELGGAITYIAAAGSGENVINNKDWGRQVQMSFYSGPIPYEPEGKKANPHWLNIGWNPIQSGDVANNRSKILAHSNNGKTIYIKCIPMHWPLDNLPGECYFESWISLDNNAVKVRSRLINQRPDKTQYQAREQELPAVYTNAPFHKLITYKGNKPFSHDTLSIVPNKNYSGNDDIQFPATENWAANVNDQGYGLGIWSEGTEKFACGFFGDSFHGGSKSDPTGYIAPNYIDIIDHNITYDFNYTMILGTTGEIRDYVYKNAKKKSLPSFYFDRTRLHWYYEHAEDTGWPIKSALDIKLKPGATLLSPDMFWRAEDASQVLVEMAVQGEIKQADLYWRAINKTFNEQDKLNFKIIADGKFHTYRISLKDSPMYQDILAGLKVKFDVVEKSSNAKVLIKSIALKK